ncbi:MAG: Delta7-sterol 5-desaturase [Chthoniobacter sp.]|jgi:sterol desaturase/sphingolipid hydroxylase (fatty acid hydroxylase superfamily)|nr:Delta7-sterol 5-desaturase [Chthoniobacter sp.]
MMHELKAFFVTTFWISIETGFRYFLAAGLAWVVFYLLFARCWKHRKIISKAPQSADVWREIRHSMVTLLVFGAVGAVTVAFIRAGMTRMYFRLHEHGWGWFWISFGIAILLHDTWFYWTHRLMHHPKLFRAVHRVHHLSTNPTPWAAYAFSPLEAVAQAAIFPIVVFLVPIHPLAFLAFMVWQISFNVIGHTGFEIHARWLLDSWVGRFLNTPTNHVMHHESLRGNYGIYFNVWDRLMGTNHERYEERFREVTSRPRNTASNAPLLPTKPLGLTAEEGLT